MILLSDLAIREDGGLALGITVKEIPRNINMMKVMMPTLVIHVRGAFGEFDMFGDSTEDTLNQYRDLVVKANAGALAPINFKELDAMIAKLKEQYIPPPPPPAEAPVEPAKVIDEVAAAKEHRDLP